LTCESQGGNPWPRLTFVINGTRVDPDALEPLHYGYNAVKILKVQIEHANTEVSCIAENNASSLPVSSNHRQLKVKFGASNVFIKGASEIKHNQVGNYSCYTDSCYPPCSIKVSVFDDFGGEIPFLSSKNPLMKSGMGFSSNVELNFTTEQVKGDKVLIECTAENSERMVIERLEVKIKKKVDLSSIKMYGPQTYEVDKLNVYNCTADEEYSSGKLEIYWQVIDERGDMLEFSNIATHNHENGLVSAIEFTGNEENENVTVICKASNPAGVSESSIQVSKVESPDIVKLVAPEMSYIGMRLEFECSTKIVSPMPLMHWRVSDFFGNEVKFDKMNHMAVDKTLVSQISVTPEYDGRNLEVQCFAQNSVGYAENSLEIELTYLSIQIHGLEEGENITQGSLIQVECSIESIPNVKTVNWYINGELKETNTLIQHPSRLVNGINIDATTLGEITLECKPNLLDAGFVKNDFGASVKFKVIEEEEEFLDHTTFEYITTEGIDYYDEKMENLSVNYENGTILAMADDESNERVTELDPYLENLNEGDENKQVMDYNDNIDLYPVEDKNTEKAIENHEIEETIEEYDIIPDNAGLKNEIDEDSYDLSSESEYYVGGYWDDYYDDTVDYEENIENYDANTEHYVEDTKNYDETSVNYVENYEDYVEDIKNNDETTENYDENTENYYETTYNEKSENNDGNSENYDINTENNDGNSENYDINTENYYDNSENFSKNYDKDIESYDTENYYENSEIYDGNTESNDKLFYQDKVNDENSNELSSELENMNKHENTEKPVHDDFYDQNLRHQNNDYDEYKSVEYYESDEVTENYEYSFTEYTHSETMKNTFREETIKNQMVTKDGDEGYESSTVGSDDYYVNTISPTDDAFDSYEDDDYETYDYSVLDLEGSDAVHHYDATMSQESSFENEEVVLTEHGSDDYKVVEYNEAQDDATNTFNAAEPKINNLKQNNENIQKVTASFPIPKEHRSVSSAISYSSLPIFNCLIFTFYQLYNL